MAEFELDHFEARVQALLTAHQDLQVQHRRLEQSLAAEQQRNREARQRLEQLLARVKVLEAEDP